MTMTSEEIVRDYNQASNKSKQIKILADLNCCSPSEIRQVLAEAGVAGVKAPERIVKRKPEAQEPAQEPEQRQCSALSGLSSSREIYDRIETILAALPGDATKYIKNNAYNLVVGLFSSYVENRLAMEVQSGADADN